MVEEVNLEVIQNVQQDQLDHGTDNTSEQVNVETA